MVQRDFPGFGMRILSLSLLGARSQCVVNFLLQCGCRKSSTSFLFCFVFAKQLSLGIYINI